MPSKKNKRAVAIVTAQPLTLEITIPAPAVPLFKAMAELRSAMADEIPKSERKYLKGISDAEYLQHWSLEDVAAHAVVRWIVSEEAMELMDSAINRLLKAE